MKLSKETKVRVLENFYAIDYILFGKHAKKVKMTKEDRESYYAVKGAILSTLIEMYKLVGHSPKSLKEKVDLTKLVKSARSSAKVARENCQKLVVTEKGRSDVKKAVEESVKTAKGTIDIEKIVQGEIRKKAFGLALDNLLIARTIQESKKYKNMNEWEGKIIEDAYKILRDNLVDTAVKIIK